MTCPPLNIGVDATAFQEPATGIARHIAGILDQLQHIDDHNRYILFEARTSDYRLHNPRWRKVQLPGPGLLTFRMQAYLPKLLRRCGINVFWAGRQFCPIAAPAHVSVVLTVHDFVYRRYPQTMKPSTRLLYLLLIPRSVSRANRLVAVSEFVGRELKRFHPEIPDRRISIVPNAHPGWTLPPDYDSSSRQPFLFFAGNFEPRKNLLNVVKALEILQEQGGCPPLHIAGPPGWSNSELGRHIRRSPVFEKVVRLGYLDEGALRREFLTCKAFIFPSVYEGFGIPVLEALSQDCIVLTSRGTVMEEIAGPAARYFDPADPAGIATAIAEVFSTDFAHGQPRLDAEALLARYSWHESAQRLLHVFEEEGNRGHSA